MQKKTEWPIEKQWATEGQELLTRHWMKNFPCPRHRTDIHLVGNHIYVAAGRGGLWVIDVSDPTAPVVVSNHRTVGPANGVFVAEDQAYVADGVGGLSITRRGARKSPLFLPLTPKALPTPSRSSIRR